MKRRVRIHKAQLGGVQALQEQQAQLQSQANDEAILGSIVAKLDQEDEGVMLEDILKDLMSAGLEQEKATQLVRTAMSIKEERDALSNAQAEDDQEAITDIEADQDALTAQVEEEDRENAILAQMYESDNYDDSYAEEDQFVQDNIMESRPVEKLGGVPNKRSFVKKVSKVIKAQMGQEMPNAKADSTDTGARQMMMSSFLKSVQNTGNSALIKKDAEEAYNMTSMYPYSEGNMPEAQFGTNMSSGQERRFNRRLNRSIGKIAIPTQGMMPAGFMTYPMLQSMQQYMPANGVITGGPKLANIDVHKTGLFGRPKEYTITFANEAMYNPTLRKQVIKQEARNRNVLTEDEIDELLQKEEEITGTTTETVKAEEEKEAKGKKDISESKAANNVNSSTLRKQNTAPQQSIIENYVNPMDAAVKRNVVLPGNITVKNPFSNKPAAPSLNPMDKAMQQYSKNKQQLFYPQQQMGGFTDETSGLTKFIYGGDDFTIPSTEGKLTDSPYFENGGSLDEMQFGGRRFMNRLYDQAFQYNQEGRGPKIANINANKKGLFRKNYDIEFAPQMEEMGQSYGTGAMDSPSTNVQTQTSAPMFTGSSMAPPGSKQYGGMFQTAGETDSTIVDILDASGNVVRQGTLSEAERAGLRHRISKDQSVTKTSGSRNVSQGATFAPYVFPGGIPIRQKGLPYDPNTGKTYYGGFSPYGQVDKIKVTKTRRLSGLPKQFTMYYTDYFPTDDTVNATSSKSNIATAQEEQPQSERGNLYWKTRQLFQNAEGTKERSQSPAIRNWMDQKRADKYGVPFTEPKQFGGDMDYAQVGLNYPNMNDSRFYPELPSEDEQEAFIRAAGSLETPTADSGPLEFGDVLGMKNYVRTQVNKQGIDPTAFGTAEELKPILADPKQKAIDMRAGRNRSNQDYIQGLMIANTFGNAALNALGERGGKQQEIQRRNKYLSDNLYGSTGQYDRGTYETNSGLFRPDEMGFTGVVRDGGSIYAEGGETYMSEDQIRKFLEEGGELEFV